MTKPCRSDCSNRNAHSSARRHASGGVVRRTDVDELRARPDRVRNVAPGRGEAVRGHRIDAIRLGAGKQRRALVDLIERIGHQHHARRRRRRSPSARTRKEPRGFQAPAEPQSPDRATRGRIDARARRRSPCAARAIRSSWDNSPALEACNERIGEGAPVSDAGARRSQIDRRQSRVRRNAGEALPEPLERIRRQQRKRGFNVKDRRGERESIRDPGRRAPEWCGPHDAMPALIEAAASAVGRRRRAWRIASWVATASGIIALGYAIASGDGGG